MPVDHEPLPERAAILRDMTAQAILNEARMITEAGGNQKQLNAAMEEALLGVFEGWLRGLQVSGPLRERLTRLYTHTLIRELASLTKPSVV
jgi:hypothetical protein